MEPLSPPGRTGPGGGCRMPAVNGVGEPCAGEPHARVEVAGAGNGATWPWPRQRSGPQAKAGEKWLPDLTPGDATAPPPQPTHAHLRQRQEAAAPAANGEGVAGSCGVVVGRRARAGVRARRRALLAEEADGRRAGRMKLGPGLTGINGHGTMGSDGLSVAPADPALHSTAVRG